MCLPVQDEGSAILSRAAAAGRDRGFADSPVEEDGFELPVPGRSYSAAMRSQVISRCSSLSPVRRGGGMRIMRSPSHGGAPRHAGLIGITTIPLVILAEPGWS
jgi:hypothetical protein